MEEQVRNIEEVNEIVTSGLRKGLFVTAGIGATALVGGLVYKKVVKPMIARAKAEKQIIDDSSTEMENSNIPKEEYE